MTRGMQNPVNEAKWEHDQVLYTLAHEIAGSFAVLSNALEFMESDEPEGEAGHFLRVARRTIRKTEMLVEDLLTAASIHHGRLPITPVPVRLDDLLAEAVDSVAPETAARSQDVGLAVPTAEIWVEADPRYIGRVLFNLLRNASKYSPHGAPIRVSARVLSRSVRISVEDNGQGIPREDLCRIFEPFYRARSSRPETGTGLGLAIARAIVQAHGGRIGVISRVGEGTRVWFTLAAADKPAPSAGAIEGDGCAK